MRYDQIDKTLFIKNRKKLVAKLKNSSVAIVNSNDKMPRNGDQFYTYRQNSDLFYLTGIDQEKTSLILCPGHPNEKFREALFIRKSDKLLEIWEGYKLTEDEAKKISGIANVYWINDLEYMLNEFVLNSENVYLNSNESPKFSTEVESKDRRFGRLVQTKFPNHKFHRLAPILSVLRMQKETEEIDLIKKACNITGKAFLKLLKSIKQGIKEFEIEAEMSFEFNMNKANGHAYAPIIASGKNACILHYIDNNKTCNYGDMVLMDFGAEYANYASDCTRTVPVNGKFTARQKEVYNSVLSILKKTIKLMVPGITINKLNKKVAQLIENELIKLKLITKKEIEKQSQEEPLYTKYFMHGVSHFIGLDVHDVGSKDEVFKPGMILSCEPAIYILEESLGIRLENDILITKDGQIDLTESIPIEIEEIEGLMDRKI